VRPVPEGSSVTQQAQPPPEGGSAPAGQGPPADFQPRFHQTGYPVPPGESAYPGPPGQPAYPGPVGPASGPAPGPMVPGPPRETLRAPRRVEAVPGTPFGLVHLDVPPVTSGPAVAALVTGIASTAVSLLVVCFGVLGARAGWGGWVAGAFAVLGGLLGGAAVLLGLFARRQIRCPAPPPAIRFTGGKLATAGLICGAVGLGVTVLALGLALLLQIG
jgi:hypothetical protein